MSVHVKEVERGKIELSAVWNDIEYYTIVEAQAVSTAQILNFANSVRGM